MTITVKSGVVMRGKEAQLMVERNKERFGADGNGQVQ